MDFCVIFPQFFFVIFLRLTLPYSIIKNWEIGGNEYDEEVIFVE
jgi:hypothetical protein